MKQLVIYLMAVPEVPELAKAAVEGGADVLEPGLPVPDPPACVRVMRAPPTRPLPRARHTSARPPG